MRIGIAGRRRLRRGDGGRPSPWKMRTSCGAQVGVAALTDVGNRMNCSVRLIVPLRIRPDDTNSGGITKGGFGSGQAIVGLVGVWAALLRRHLGAGQAQRRESDCETERTAARARPATLRSDTAVIARPPIDVTFAAA